MEIKIKKINCILSSKDIDFLKPLKGSDISIFSETIDSKTAIIKLQRNDIICFITNEPTEQEDGDEYPVLRINTSSSFAFNANFVLENAKLLSLCSVRDKICWTRDGVRWEVEIDIGMKIATDKKEVLLLATDSVGGLMTFTSGVDIKTPDSESELKEQWIYKSDEFISLHRILIPVL